MLKSRFRWLKFVASFSFVVVCVITVGFQNARSSVAAQSQGTEQHAPVALVTLGQEIAPATEHAATIAPKEAAQVGQHGTYVPPAPAPAFTSADQQEPATAIITKKTNEAVQFSAKKIDVGVETSVPPPVH